LTFRDYQSLTFVYTFYQSQLVTAYTHVTGANLMISPTTSESQIYVGCH